MSEQLRWQGFDKADKEKMLDTRLQAHYAVQWVTRIARSFLEPRDDDSHSSLSWDSDLQALICDKIDNQGMLVGLRLKDMNLLIGKKNGDMSCFPLQGCKDAEAGAWVMDKIAVEGSYGKVQAPLPYDLPDHPLQKNAIYTPDATACKALSGFYHNAAFLFEKNILQEYRHITPGPSPVRCWPHHFDIASLMPLELGDAETARAIGIGMSPGDESYDQPYFYINPWPHLDKENLPSLPPPGRWHIEGFVGAIALADDIIEKANTDSLMGHYLRTTIDICFEAMGYQQPIL